MHGGSPAHLGLQASHQLQLHAAGGCIVYSSMHMVSSKASCQYNVHVQKQLLEFSKPIRLLYNTAPVVHRKRLQVTVATTTTCASRVSAPVGCRRRPPDSASYSGPVAAHAPFAPPHVPENKCTQWLKKETISAKYSQSEPALPPLERTLQQANVTCLRACH